MRKSCRCGSRESFSDCCKPLLDGRHSSVTPEQLVRSRYTAYALGGYGDYLLQTWFPATAKGLTAADLSVVTRNWTALKIFASGVDGNTGWVDFRATHQSASGPSILHEKSVFTCAAGIWLYIGGEILSS